MAKTIPRIEVDAELTPQDAARLRADIGPAEAQVEEDIWGQRGHLIADAGQLLVSPHGGQEGRRYSCPLAAVQDLGPDVLAADLDGQRCYFRLRPHSLDGRRCYCGLGPGHIDEVEEVWLLAVPAESSFSKLGEVVKSNVDKGFCHVRLHNVDGEWCHVICFFNKLKVVAAEVFEGRRCSLEYEESSNKGQATLVATKLHFDPIVGRIDDVQELGVTVKCGGDWRYFAAYDQAACLLPSERQILLHKSVSFHLRGPVSSPEACAWQIVGFPVSHQWSPPRAPKWCPTTCDVVALPKFPAREGDLVIASDPLKTKLRDDAFECLLDSEAGTGYVRVHIFNAAGVLPKDSAQERWMLRVLGRHHPVDASRMRPLIEASGEQGIGLSTDQHRLALTMQYTLQKHDGEWAVVGDAQFFESMVRLTALTDALKITEEWVRDSSEPTPQGLVVFPPNADDGIVCQVHQAFHDAQVAVDHRHRRLDALSQLITRDEPLPADEPVPTQELPSDGLDIDATDKGSASSSKLPSINMQLDYNSNNRRLKLVVEEYQPAQYFATRLLSVFSTEAFRLLDGYKEVIGTCSSDIVERADVHQHSAQVREMLMALVPAECDKYESEASFQNLAKHYVHDVGGDFDGLYHALGWNEVRPRRLLYVAADVPDDVCPRVGLTKPCRAYHELVTQRVFLDLVRNKMRRPRPMSYGMSELRSLVARHNARVVQKEEFERTRALALLRRAWPEIERQGGLPQPAVVVGEVDEHTASPKVYVRMLDDTIECPALQAQAVVGTPVIVLLHDLPEGRYVAEPLHAFCRESPRRDGELAGQDEAPHESLAPQRSNDGQTAVAGMAAAAAAPVDLFAWLDPHGSDRARAIRVA